MRRLLFALLIIAGCTDAVRPTSLDVSFLVVSGDGQTGTVGNTLAQPLVIKAADSKGRTLRNVPVEFRVTSGGGSVSPATINTNNQGRAQTHWTLGTSTSVPQQVEARVVSTGQVVGSFTATALPGPPAQMVMVSADSQTTVRLTAVPIPPAVRITDQYDNPVPGKSVTFAIPFYDEGGSVTGNPAVSNAEGIATVGSWVVGPAVGRHWVHARIPELALVVVTFTALGTLENGARMALYAGDNQVAPVGTTLPIRLAVRITDAANAPIPGAQPQFSWVQAGGSIGGITPDADTNGVAAPNYVTLCCTRGIYRLRTILAGSPDTVFFTATGTAASPNRIAVQAGDGQSALTNATVAIAPAAIVRDTFNNPVPRVTVDFAVTGGGGSVSGTPAVTDTNGIATVGSWTLGSDLGTNTLSATVSGLSGAATFAATATIRPASASRSTVVAAPATIVASNGASLSTITVTAVADNGLPIEGASVIVVASGSGNRVTQPTSPTDSNGVTTATLSATTSGTKTLTARIGNVWVTQTAQVTVTPGAPARLSATVSRNQTAPIGRLVAAPPALRVLDAFENGVPGVSVTFAVTRGGGTITGTNPVLTNASGAAALDSWTLGSQPDTNTVTVTVDGEGIANNPLIYTAIGVTEFWERLADMPTRRFGLGAAGANGQLYAIGGVDFDYMTTVEAYDPVTNTWTARAPLPQPRGLFGIGVINGIIYAVGGTGSPGSGVDRSVAAYDPLTDTWTGRAPLPTPRYDLSVAVVNGILYAIGGSLFDPSCSCVRQVGTVEAYDPATDTWTARAPMPTARSSFGAATLNGVIYAVGGADWREALGLGLSWISATEAYDPATDSWTTRAPIPTPRFWLGAAVLDGALYVAGGAVPNGSTVMSTDAFEAYDPVTDAWTPKQRLPSPIEMMGVAALNGLFYRVGGNGIPGAEVLEAYHRP